ncbi:MAG TPA: SDR family NAD(P)-dependent oxidoreductase [Steroidobacteraceae bacterium]|nr:SDR family NAD(P)-dependent oxidoreductase [Steroidobacteraceae bacterium]
MSDPKKPSKSSLSSAGRARRRFLGGSALAAVGTSAAALTRGLTASAAVPALAGAPSECPSVPTPMKDVAGKVAFITGGDSGIGLGIARAFTAAGMKVVITYRSKKHLDDAMKALSRAGDRVHAVDLDVTDRAAMRRAAEETERVFGKVHVIVNNAGVGIFGGLSKATYDDWDWGMGVNATGVFNGIHTFLPRIQAHGEGGQVMATSSVAGIIAHGGTGVYSTSKFAVVGMMEALRNELAETNIGVSVFCPGLVNTDIGDSNRNRPNSLADSGVKPDPKMMARMRAQMKAMRGPPPGMDPLEAGQRVLNGMRNNDLYILTTPELEPDIAARGEAIVASIPTDVHPPAARVALQRMIAGKTVYATVRDRMRCERARSRKV